MDSSSDEDNGEYTTTNVTLGYVSKESAGDDVSHLGGYSTFEFSQRPPARLARCKVCSGYTSLLLQLNADLQQHFPNDDRRLHVMCCRRKSCAKKIGSVRAFREVRKPAVRQRQKEADPVTKQQTEHKNRPDLGAALFGGSGHTASNTANPFATRSQPLAGTNPFSSTPQAPSLAAMPPQLPAKDTEPPVATFADKLKISSETPSAPIEPQEPWPEDSQLPAPFSRYYLDAEGEELESEKKSNSTPNGTSTDQRYEVDDASSSAMDKDSFESTLDKTFQKFSDRVAQNPEQVLRYEYKGHPLLYSGNDNVASRFVVPHGKAGAARGMPRCEECGAQRVFETQLVPGLIYELEKDDAMDLDDGMEWGTILIGTCSNNCGEAGQVSFREEWAGVQWEERVKKA